MAYLLIENYGTTSIGSVLSAVTRGETELPNEGDVVRAIVLEKDPKKVGLDDNAILDIVEADDTPEGREAVREAIDHHFAEPEAAWADAYETRKRVD